MVRLTGRPDMTIAVDLYVKLLSKNKPKPIYGNLENNYQVFTYSAGQGLISMYLDPHLN